MTCGTVNNGTVSGGVYRSDSGGGKSGRMGDAAGERKSGGRSGWKVRR